jgi:sulfatase maturation enzyme AslB (radical SAM superfamily)
MDTLSSFAQVEASTICSETPQFQLRSLVLQPTTSCNLNCGYCYLPDRKTARYMSPAICLRLADEIVVLGEPLTLIWHGGEPLVSIDNDIF